MIISPLSRIEREKIGPLGILMRVDDGFYVCNCTVYSHVLKQCTQQAFFYDIYFSTKEKIVCCGASIDNRSYAPLCVLDEKDRKIKRTMKNMLMDFFEGTYIVKYAFKFTSQNSP